MTWKEIKIATLQKMQSADGNNIPSDSSANDYLAAMPQAANEALQLLTTANKFIIKSIQISHMPIKNILTENKVQSVDSGDIIFKADGAKSYYLEICGKGTVSIKVGDTVTETIDIDSKTKYQPQKGLIFNINGEEVTLTVNSDYPITVKNVALYKATLESEDDVVPFSRLIRYDLKELAPDFYMLNSGEVYFEDTEYHRSNDYAIEAGHIIVIDREQKGNFTIYYKAYPTTITSNTSDNYELPLSSDVVTLLPLYMVSQIYKDADISIATQCRNEFDAARAELQNSYPSSELETIIDESGW